MGATKTACFLPCLISGLFLATGKVRAQEDWWNLGYQERARLIIRHSNPAPLPSEYTVSLSFDHQSLVKEGRSLSNGQDVRVIYHSKDGFQELDRILDQGSGWNQNQTKLLFRTVAIIDQEDDSYYLYFSYPQAGKPPARPDQVFALYQDFEALPLGLMPPEWEKFGTDLELKVEVSQEQALSGTKSLKLSGNGWAKSAYRRSPCGVNYTASISFLTLDGGEGGLYFRSSLINTFHPAWVFQMGDWWYAGGNQNLKTKEAIPPPQPSQWSTLEAKVVDREIVYLKVNHQEAFAHLQTHWAGEYLGASFRGTKLVYYDDLWIKKAAVHEPQVKLSPAETQQAPFLEISLLGDSSLEFGPVIPNKPVYQDLVLKIKTNQPYYQIRAFLRHPLAKPATGKIIPPWNGSKGLGIKLAQEEFYQPLSGKETLIYQTSGDQADSEVELGIRVILATDFLDPAGEYQASLNLLVMIEES